MQSPDKQSLKLLSKILISVNDLQQKPLKHKSYDF